VVSHALSLLLLYTTDVAQQIDCEGELMHHDMGEGLPFRAGMFDGAISVSALQWLCNADRKSHVPKKRLMVFFQSLYKCLARGARAVFQFYPANVDQLDMITTAAMKCGFSGGIVTDFPHSTKAKKYASVFGEREGMREREV
jgi:18S rRNA (guanine1575-N7)-methyltransferase